MNLQEIIALGLDYARGMWRYRWWALAVSWIILVVGAAYVYMMPNVYQASAKVFVDTNSLLKPLMKGLTVSENTLRQVDLFSRALLTRPNMEKVAHETGLDLRAHSQRQMEGLVTQLQDKIHISSGRNNIFTISYADPDRDKARAVVAAVLDTFVEGALGHEGTDAKITSEALQNELDVHRSRLHETEEALAKFKRENLGFMPGQYGGYFDQLQAATTSVEQTQAQLKVAEQRRDELRRQINGTSSVIGVEPGSTEGAIMGCSQSDQLSALQTELSNLRIQYTEKYPRVIAMEAMIAHLKDKCRNELAVTTGNAALAASIQPGDALAANPVYQDMKIQLSKAEVQIVALTAELKAKKAKVAGLKHDVDKITNVETKLKQLTRDYSVVQARYKKLLKRWEDLQAKKRLDPITSNVKFRRIEPPFALPDPVGPNRPLLLAGVLIVALGVGLGLTFVLNQLQPVFYRTGALHRIVEVPILGAVGAIMSPQAVARRRRGKWAWSLLCILLVVAAGLAVSFAGPGGTLVRGLMGAA